ncbi:MAG: HD family phosphohydrolase [Bacteroidales bacterium]|nr:HD family phosphohydrolase [Bacteroidales bacterium]
MATNIIITPEQEAQVAQLKLWFEKSLRNTQREGIDNVLWQLDERGFYTAPASAGHHLNEPGGLVLHSMHVFQMAKLLKATLKGGSNMITGETLMPEIDTLLPDDSIVIATLLHDVCKTAIYVQATKRQKLPNGVWTDVLGYNLDYSWAPFGHGEKSVIMLQNWGLKMTEDEMLAIRWHMSAWDLPFQSAEEKSSLNAAKENSALLTLVQTADGMAAGIMENDWTAAITRLKNKGEADRFTL